MEGPYRDLGSGFARLLGAEGLRRSAGRIRSVEDALLELLRNSRDAGARNVYVASSLRARRYRALVVIDDGCGIPETHKNLIFEPGVTTRHLNPVSYAAQNGLRQDGELLHGAGLSLYHIKNAAILAEVLSVSSPTAIKVILDTHAIPEKSLQSDSRTSKSNLPATLAGFAEGAAPQAPRLYYASPARILARLLDHHVIHNENRADTGRLREAAWGLGLKVSLRTVQRVVSGRVSAAGEVVTDRLEEAGGEDGRARSSVTRHNQIGGPILSVRDEDLAEITATLRRAARSSYLDLAGLDVEKRPGEVILRARIYEPEEEYE